MMKKHFTILFAMAALLLFAGSRSARAYTEPYVTWDPQSLAFAVGSDAEYSATVSGHDLSFTWYVEFAGKEYEMPARKADLMAAGMQYCCDDIVIKSSANRTSIIFKNIGVGIDGSSGKWTRVYCHAFDGVTGVDTNWAMVSCNGYGLMEAGYPPTIYVKPVVNLQPEDTGKIGFDLVDEEVYYVVDKSYQWYRYSGGSYDVGLKAIPGEDGPIYISAADYDESEDIVIGVNLKLNGGGDYWIYSSPINVNRLSGDIDYSWDQLIIRKKPDRLKGYELGDKPDLTGLQAEYIANDKSQGIVPIASLKTDIDTFTYAGPVWVTVSYKDQSNGFTVWVDPGEKNNWEIKVPETTEAPTTAPETPAETTVPETTTAETPPETAAPETPEETTAQTETAGTEAESTIAPETAAPSSEEEKTTAVPVSSEVPATTQSSTEKEATGSGGFNTVLIIIIIVLAMICGLFGGILLGKKKAK